MSTKPLMYEVKKHGPGAAMLIGPNPQEFFRRCAVRVNDYTRGRYGSYPADTFLFNVESVCEDIRAGRIKEPPDMAGWVDAVLAEYTANDAAAPPGLTGL